MSNFRSDDSFPVKTGICPKRMVDHSYDVENPTYAKIVTVLTR